MKISNIPSEHMFFEVSTAPELSKTVFFDIVRTTRVLRTVFGCILFDFGRLLASLLEPKTY